MDHLLTHEKLRLYLKRRSITRYNPEDIFDDDEPCLSRN